MARDMLPMPPSLDGLIEWLKTKEPEGTYLYVDNRNCLLAQYLRAIGHDILDVGPDCYTVKGETLHRLPSGLNDAALHGPFISNVQLRTYGGALKVALKIKAEA